MTIPAVAPQTIVEAVARMSRWQRWRMRRGRVYHLETRATPHGDIDLYVRWCARHGHVATVDTSLYPGHQEFRCPSCDREFFAREAQAAAARRRV